MWPTQLALPDEQQCEALEKRSRPQSAKKQRWRKSTAAKRRGQRRGKISTVNFADEWLSELAKASLQAVQSSEHDRESGDGNAIPERAAFEEAKRLQGRMEVLRARILKKSGRELRQFVQLDGRLQNLRQGRRPVGTQVGAEETAAVPMAREPQLGSEQHAGVAELQEQLLAMQRRAEAAENQLRQAC